MSKKKPLTSSEGLATDDLEIWYVIGRSWCTHESPDWKRDWLQLRSLLSFRYLKRELKIIFSKKLQQIWRVTLVYNLLLFFVTFFMNWDHICLLPFTWKYSYITLLLKRICISRDIDLGNNFNMRNEIPSQPWALFRFNEQISLIIVSMSILMSEGLAAVSMVWLLGRELSFVLWKSH